jgi:LuxR family maltose regulon positive regulatory protein
MKRQKFVPVPASIDNKPIHLDRPRMDGLLAGALKSDLIAVVAGAGYGKTEAVYSFLRKQDCLIVWVQLSELDNAPTRFWETYTQAISSINPAIAKTMADAGFPSDGGFYNRYADSMADALVVGRRYVIVFDDFHLLHDPSVLKFLSRSVDWHFPHMSRIYITREDPVGFIAEHLPKNTFAHLNEDDLRFTKEEMKAFFALQGAELSSDTADRMYADTDGWIFAIHLASLFFKKNPGRASYALSAMKSNVTKLIDSEIFSELPEDQKRFLIKMSLLNHLSPELLGRLPDADRLLEELNRINSFVRHDAYLDTYRIHNLFLDYLKEKQDILTEEEKADTYRVAADWCLGNGYLIDAVRYYKKLNDYDRIVEIAYGLPMLTPPGIGSYLVGILGEAPNEAFERNGTLSAVYGRLLLATGRLGEAAEFIRITIQKTETLPESDYKNRVLFGHHNNLGFIGLVNGPRSKNYDFPRHFEKADEYYRKSNYLVTGAIRSINLSAYVCRIGRSDPGEPDRYTDALAALVPFSSHTMNGCMYGIDDLARCELSFFRGELENCERFGYQALYKAKEKEQHDIENRALFFLLRMNLAGGKYREVKSILEQAEAQPEQSDYANKYVMKDIVTSWFYAQIGHAERMANWITNDFDESEVNYLLRGLEFFTKNKYYIAEKKYSRLLAMLESQDTESGIGVFLYGKIGIAINKAVCLYHLKEKQAAVRCLEDAYALASPNALDMPFIELGNETRVLVGFALKNGSNIHAGWLEMIRSKATTYAKRLAHVRTRWGEDEKIHDAVDLTNREIEILTDMVQGLSRIEIATARGISINTVKTMLPHIFRKLGANNMIDAIRIAVANGIVK